MEHTYLLVIYKNPKQTTSLNVFLQICRYIKPSTLLRGSIQKGYKKNPRVTFQRLIHKRETSNIKNTI